MYQSSERQSSISSQPRASLNVAEAGQLSEMIDCVGGCGETVDEGDMICCDICLRRSHKPCIQVLLPREYKLPAAHKISMSLCVWLCPMCRTNGANADKLEAVRMRQREWL